MELYSYTTQTFDFYFYFPQPGTFTQFPSNIAIGDKVVAKAQACELKVVREIQEASFETFRDILSSGDEAAILKFMNEGNLVNQEKGFSWDDMYWLLQE